MNKNNLQKGKIIIYKTSKNEVGLKVKLEKETVWLTQNQIALLLGTQRPAITKHLNNIFKTGELQKNSVSSILFVYFLDKSNYLFKKSGERKINDNALTALTILIAESNPKDKETMIKIIKNLIAE